MNPISSRQFALAASSLSLLLAGTSLTGCTVYSADPITATVVDADTGAPIEGVNVVAAWELQGGVNYGGIVGYVNLLETVTDHNGRFSFPAWGPRMASNGKIRLSAPVMLLFKQGYKYGVFAYNGRSTENAPEDLKSDWNNRLIPLTKFVGTAQQYDDNLRNLETIFILDLDSNGRTAEVSRFVCAVMHQRDLNNSQGAPTAQIGTDWLATHGIKC
jgi:hypothetical protein